MIKPLLNEKLFFIFFVFLFSIFSFNVVDSNLFRMLIIILFSSVLFSLYFKTRFLNGIKNYIYLYKYKHKSNFNNDTYYSYETPNGNYGHFYGKEYHSEIYPAFADEYYLFGYKLTALTKQKRTDHSVVEYLLKNENYKEENAFLNLLFENKYEEVENYIKLNKIKLNKIHYSVAIDLRSQNYIKLFMKYDKNQKENIESNILLFIKNSMFKNETKIASFFLSIVEKDLGRFNSEEISSLISYLIVCKNFKMAIKILNDRKNINFKEEEASEIFYYMKEKFPNKISFLFKYKNIIKNVSVEIKKSFGVENFKKIKKLHNNAEMF